MNIQLELDARDSLNLRASGGVHQPLLTSLLPKLVKLGDTVLDIGAHIGYFTVQLSALVGDKIPGSINSTPPGMVLAFEPAPVTFRILKENLAKNRCKNVVAVKAAVSNRTSVDKLYLCRENIGDHRLYETGEGRKWIGVDTVKLDDALLHLDKIDFVKLDIQGFEGYALLGMQKLILPVTKRLVFEFWPTALEKSGFGARRCLNLLQDAGFGFFDIREAEAKVVPITADELMSRYKAKEDDASDSIKAEDFTDVLAMREPVEEVMEMLKGEGNGKEAR